MKTASVADIKTRLDAVLKSSESGPVVVTRNGKPVAVIFGVQDKDEAERLLMAYSPKLQTIVEKSRKQIRDGDVLTHEELWAEVAALRAARRKGRQSKGGAK
jgi:prevent-host-death family protein